MMVHGIEYEKPKVYLFNQSGIGTAEFAGRTAYDSFDNSEHEYIAKVNESVKDGSLNNLELFQMNTIESSELLDQLAWVHHHHSVIEHVNLSYFIQGTSRGVLQEHARHRIQSLTVRSTRYTMSDIINAFVTSLYHDKSVGKSWFINKILEFDMFVISKDAEVMEISQMYDKLFHQYFNYDRIGFYEICLSKDNQKNLQNYKGNILDEIFEILQNGKKKRNVGDAFKWIVTDNWKVDMVVTFNLRSLKNYFDLRDSGSAYFQIQWLAEEMKRVTPEKYLRLVDKKIRGK